ncbi:MAG: lipoyl(octanoyl) transferase, partial [Polaribacter sp.]|nr:lipoyl(octanoyl) transferase [Polaribacter sp.]
MNRNILLKDLSVKDYKETWDLQTELLQEIVNIKINNRKSNLQEATKNHFLFVEHPHVYTLGKSGDLNNLLLNERQLTEKGATFYKINRGGD